MGLKQLIGGALFATFVLGGAACTGTADMGKSPEVVGERAEIVAQKRDWLRNYDENCEVCFKAFELCGKGARDQAETDACQTALDACVRGGLIKDDGNGQDADGGAVDNGNGNGGNANGGNGNVGDGDNAGDGNEEDAGVSDGNGDGDFNGGDGDFNGGDGDEADAGVDDGDNAGDGDGDNAGDGDGDNAGDGDVNAGDGDVNAGDGDNDADSDEATDEANNPNNDGDADGQPGDQVKGNLIEDVKACLDTGEACLEADGADTGDCVDALRECVKAALDDAFQNVCSTQHRQCRERNASEAETSSVENLCNEGIDAVVD